MYCRTDDRAGEGRGLPLRGRGGLGHDEGYIVMNLALAAETSGECLGVSLVVHGQHDGLLIAGNTVREDVGAYEL